MFFGSRCLLLVVGLVAAPLAILPEKPIDIQPKAPIIKTQRVPAKVDPRVARLTRFFSRLHCPIRDLAADFIAVADKNRLDWRLLPSISVVESGGGKAYRNNNIFGWGNGELRFPTIQAGLEEVAFKLGHSSLYRNRDSVSKLRIYNPDQQYVSRVVDVMKQI